MGMGEDVDALSLFGAEHHHLSAEALRFDFIDRELFVFTNNALEPSSKFERRLLEGVKVGP